MSSDSQASTPQEVVASLAQQAGQAEGPTNQRESQRFKWQGKLRLKLSENAKEHSAYRELQVQSLDISVSGFAFIHSQYVHTQTRVYARFEALPHRPTLEGLVQNCVVTRGRKYRVGVKFTEPSQPHQKPHQKN